MSVFFQVIRSQSVQTWLVDIVTSRVARNSAIHLHVGRIHFSLFNKLELEDTWIEDNNSDTLAYVGRVTANIHGIGFRKKNIRFGLVTLNECRFNISKDSQGVYNFSFLTENQHSDSLSAVPWNIQCHRFRLKNAAFIYRDSGNDRDFYEVSDINFRIDNFRTTPDSIGLRIASLSLADSRGFNIGELNADLKYANNRLMISNLNVRTLHSLIDSASIEIRQDTLPGNMQRIMHFDLDLNHVILGMADIALFAPSLRGMDQKMEVSGKFSGSPSNLKARNLHLVTGNFTDIRCDLSMNFFEDIQEPFIFLDLKLSQTDFRDLSRIKMPENTKRAFLQFPDVLVNAGIITYKGNFTGFPRDFVAYGTFKSKMGQIKTDLSFVPVSADNLRYKGRLETHDFDLGKLLKNNIFGDISLSGLVDGIYRKKSGDISGDIKGTVSKLTVNNYDYSNILLDGKIDRKRFDGKLNLDDPNLKLTFAGELDLNEDIPVFDFILNLKSADLVALRLDTMNTKSELSMEMAANFSGNNIDNLDGLIQVYNGKFTNQHNSLQFDNLTVNTHIEEKLSRISVMSDYFDGEITGTYHFSSLIESFRSVLAGFLPALGIQESQKSNTNQFRYSLNVKDLDEITAVFFPDLRITGPFTVSGLINSMASNFEMEGLIPLVRFNQVYFQNVGIVVKPDGRILDSRIKIDRIGHSNGLHFDNLILTMKASDNQIASRLEWDNSGQRRYSGEIKSDMTISRVTDHPLVDIRFQPSQVIIGDSAWHLAPAEIRIDSTTIDISGFRFNFRQQQIAVDGRISEDENDAIQFRLTGIDLNQLNGYMKEPDGIKGMLNGTFGISDFYNKRLFFSDLTLSGFVFREQLIGNITLVNKWNLDTELIGSELKVEKNNRKNLTASGFYNPNTQDLDYVFDLDNQSLVVLGTVIGDVLTNFHGDASGRVKLHGKPDKILMDGAVFCKNAGLTVDYTQVSYNLTDSVRFSGDKILFRNIQISDFYGNKGVFNGSIRHDTFGNMDFDLNVSSPKILAVNNTAKESDQFYGKAIMKGNIIIKGHDNNIVLSGEATSLPETSINIVLSDASEVTKYNFVRFVTGRQQPVTAVPLPVQPEEDGFEIDLLVHATPDAKVQMMFSSQISDEIRGQGEGTLRFAMDKKGNISLSGNFTVEQGEYLFTLQDVIKKRFMVEPGGSLTWSGNPYEAVIDLNAIYKLKASLIELMAGSLENLSNSQRIPVECKITLTGELMRPDISLGIAFPTLEERLKDELQQFFTTPEDLNRQMLSLLVLGKFYTPDFVRGNYESSATGMIGNTASDLFSRQLSNWLSQINKDVDIGFNYRPGNQITNDEIELALSTQIFNDRVSINGNIGNNTNPNSFNNNELVGDFDINVKLTRNGKLQLKAYNRANNNLIYETAPYTQGIGISYKENYNTAGELLNNLLSVFRRNEQRDPVRREKVVTD